MINSGFLAMNFAASSTQAPQRNWKLLAPAYPPARSYATPVELPFTPSVDTLSVEELLAIETIRRILLAIAPFKDLVENTQMKDQLGNSTLSAFRSLVPPEIIGRVDQLLHDPSLAGKERG